MRRPIVTKRSTANANTEKSIPPAMSQPESAPHPRHVAKACDNNTQTIPNNMVLWQRLATCRRGYRDLQSATVFPGILPFRYTCKSIAFCQSCAIFRKKGHCSNLIFGAVNTLAFWTPRSGPPQFSTWMFVSSFLPFVVSWFLANF